MNKSIIAVIFDLDFNEFVTTRIIKILFILSIVVAGIWSLLILGAGLASKNALTILGALIVTPLAFLFAVVMSRVWLELIIVVFRIAENTSRLVQQGQTGIDQSGK